MQWYILAALVALSVFVGALAIELLAIVQFAKSTNTEMRNFWTTIQDRLKFLAAPSGTVLMALMAAGGVASDGDTRSWLCVMLASFVVVVILSSTWTPLRFKRLNQLLVAETKRTPLDRTLVVLWVVRIVMLVLILGIGANLLP